MEIKKITVSDAELRKGAEEGMDAFLKVFTDKYIEVTGGEINAETMPLLNGFQHSLLGYHIFREEVDSEWLRSVYLRKSFCKSYAYVWCKGFCKTDL